jgi:dTDP-4-dehydrorhamnose reductase
MLILGATGFLGKNLVREIQKVMPWVEITTHSRQSDSDITFDLTNAAAVNDFFRPCA